MPRVVPLSARLAAFHENQRDWHVSMAREHGRRGHRLAQQDHLDAAAAHEAAMAAPLDQARARAAMRASGLADQSSQEAGVRQLMGWS